MSRPPRVLVSGYYGFGNAGDEAILAGVVAGLHGLMPAPEPTILSGDPAATEAEHGVRAAPRGLISAYRLSRQSDLLISGGGGLLQDLTSWRSPLYYLGVLRLARAVGLPAACIGHGIGPLRRRVTRGLAHRELSRVEVVAVRDAASAENLREMGLGRPVEVTADLAFLLPRPTAEEVDRAWQKAELRRGEQPAVAIALRPPPEHRTGRDLAARLGGAIGTACDHLGLDPVLVPMQRTRDVEFASLVSAGMPSATQVVAGEMSARDLLAVIGGCELVVAMRLHALVFGAICGVAPVAISYDPKVDGLMGQLGLQSATSVTSLNEEALGRVISQTWESRSHLSAQLTPRVDKLRDDAGRNIELVSRLLAGRD